MQTAASRKSWDGVDALTSHPGVAGVLQALEASGVRWFARDDADARGTADDRVDLTIGTADLPRARAVLKDRRFLEYVDGGGPDFASFVSYDPRADEWLRIRVRAETDFAGPASVVTDRASDNPVARVLGALRETIWRLTLRRKSGITVALLGPDGCGKSTLSRNIVESYFFPVRTVYMGMWQQSEEDLLGKVFPAWRPVRRLLKVWAGFMTGWYHRSLGRLVIFDRYTYDALLPSHEEHGMVARLYTWLLGHACPAPDLVVVLDAPGEVMYARKHESSPERLEAERQGFLSLRERIRDLHVVDATLPEADVCKVVIDQIWDRSFEVTEKEAVGSVPTETEGEPSTSPTESTSTSATTEHIRGSSLLVGGRLVAYALEFVAQVLLIRALSKDEFGEFAYALSIAVALKSFVMLALPDTVSRFISFYRERGMYGAALGSMVLSAVSIAGAGILAVVGVHIAVGPLGLRPIADSDALLLLTILALLIPIEGLDALLTSILAALAGASQIAFRQIITPLLKIGVVLVVMMTGTHVSFLAIGYVAASCISLMIYAWMLVQLLRQQTWAREWWPRPLSFPFREVFGFALPLLASTVVWTLMESSDAALLGYFLDDKAVAAFRAVLPVPRVLSLLSMTFVVMYTPIAARLYARGDHRALADLYRNTALWMTVVSFPIFALAFGFSSSTTIGLFGSQYADSAAVMAVLSFGYFFSAVTGPNGLTLKTYGKLSYSVAVDVAAAILNVAANLILIPQWGVMGAAVGTSVSLMVHNALKQYGLWRYFGINLFRRPLTTTYGWILATALALLGLQSLLPASLWIALPICAVGSLFVLWVARDSLDIESVFPEIRRWPLAEAVLEAWKK